MPAGGITCHALHKRLLLVGQEMSVLFGNLMLNGHGAFAVGTCSVAYGQQLPAVEGS